MVSTTRVLLLALLVGVLGLSFVEMGKVKEGPEDAIRSADTKRPVSDLESSVGKEVIVRGQVASRDPLVVRVPTDAGGRMSVPGSIEASVSVGDRVYVVGTLLTASRIRADRVMVEKPWELQAMYVTSLLGGLLVAGRLALYWRIDSDALSLVPRSRES